MVRHIELTNLHTGTKFLVPVEYFTVLRPSPLAAQMDERVPKDTTLMSIFNPLVELAVKETYEDISAMIGLKDHIS